MKPFRPATFGFVRSPLLPFGEFRAEGTENIAARKAQLLAYVSAHRNVRSALKVASPALVQAIDAGGARADGALLAAMRYIERMRGRATPFALCAGYSIATSSDNGEFSANIVLQEQRLYEHTRRVDADSVALLARSMPANTESLVANACLLRRGSKYELLRRADGISTQYEVHITPAIDSLIEFCRDSRSRSECLDFLNKFSADSDERSAFLETLCEAEILVPTSSAILTTDDELRVLDPLPPGLRQYGRTRTLGASEFGPLPEGVNAIHDLFKPTTEALISTPMASLTSVIAALSGAFPRAADARITSLRRWLIERYEFSAAPLLEALDPEGGFLFDVAEEQKRPAENWVLRELPKLWMSGAKEWRLRSVDLPSGDLADAGMVLYCQTTQGPWFQAYIAGLGTQLFARATGFSKQARELCEGWIVDLARNSDGEKWADIAFFPPGKSAAFTQFPTLTPWEITVASRSEFDASRRIDLNDLWVAPGPAESVVLFEGSTGLPVRPKIAGAVNPNRSDVPGFIRLFHALSQQDAGRGAAWSWGQLSEAPYLPRVYLDDVIVAPQRWRLSQNELDEARHVGIDALREPRGLPRHVMFHEGADLMLPVDLDDPLSVAAFLDIAKESAVLVEHLEPLGVRGPEGEFCHELAVPIARERSVPPRTTRLHRHNAASRVLPGAEALFFKVYGAPDALRELLCSRAAPFLNALCAKGNIEDWFYLPYSDPHPHLRIRIFGDPAFLPTLLRDFHEGVDDLFEARRLWKLAIDTYDREVDRYGDLECLKICERIFGLSSRDSVDSFSNFYDCGDSESASVIVLAESQERFLASITTSLEDALELTRYTFQRFNRGDRASVLRAENDMTMLFREERKRGISPLKAISAELEGLTSQLRHAGGIELKTILADLLHVHSIRTCTTWPHCSDIEARGYLYLERRLGMLRALQRNRI